MCDSKACMTGAAAPARRLFLRAAGASAVAVGAGLLSASVADAAQAAAPPKPQNAISPDAALKRLRAGNARYVSGATKLHDFAHEREALSGGQNPYAAILGCADSRIAPEYAFDSARGDLFVTRVAGNFVNDDVLGSLEYAVAVLKTPAILVLGHEKCGAVDAAVKAATAGATYPGMIQSLVTSLLPSVEKAKAAKGKLVEAATVQNVLDSMANLRSRSAIIEEAVKAGKLKIAGGVYRLSTGKVDFLG
ncbi:carbonic anhydrase [Candidimonas nitroreducens]|uniref:Carbonic anhydrase n=1 Tax=Candidimonas nitroreducens TaxID=683354 RepID=A0A225M445_9BURK|nr:carbonic anhydrase [Candidimonas nitroreducens]OWT53729.1 carbonic anhydrase [Candidimonas nitroreducens]